MHPPAGGTGPDDAAGPVALTTHAAVRGRRGRGRRRQRRGAGPGEPSPSRRRRPSRVAGGPRRGERTSWPGHPAQARRDRTSGRSTPIPGPCSPDRSCAAGGSRPGRTCRLGGACRSSWFCGVGVVHLSASVPRGSRGDRRISGCIRRRGEPDRMMRRVGLVVAARRMMAGSRSLSSVVAEDGKPYPCSWSWGRGQAKSARPLPQTPTLVYDSLQRNSR